MNFAINNKKRPMSYQKLRDHLERCRDRASLTNESPDALVDALEALASAVETDLVQIKGALSHLALLLESRQGRGPYGPS
jgi:hypothetical protein